MSQVVTCDKCKCEFELTEYMVKTRALEKNKDIKHTYFKCPKCGTKYTVSLTNPEIRRMIKNGVGIKIIEPKMKELRKVYGL